MTGVTFTFVLLLGKPSPKHDMFSVIQGENSIFKMKTGLKPVLKTSNSEINLKIFYKEGKKKSTGGGDDDNWVKITALQGLSFPLSDLNSALRHISIKSQPLKSKFETFRNDMTEWESQLTVDLEKLYERSQDTELVLSTIRTHYYKLGPVINSIKALVVELKAHISPSKISAIETTLVDFNVVLKDLKKYSTIDKPTKEFQHLTLNFMGEMCLLNPCINNVNATLYPMRYDLKLGRLCADPGKGIKIYLHTYSSLFCSH